MSAFIEKLRTFLHGAETDVEAVRAELKTEVKKILAELHWENWHPLQEIEKQSQDDSDDKKQPGDSTSA